MLICFAFKSQSQTNEKGLLSAYDMKTKIEHRWREGSSRSEDRPEVTGEKYSCQKEKCLSGQRVSVDWATVESWSGEWTEADHRSETERCFNGQRKNRTDAKKSRNCAECGSEADDREMDTKGAKSVLRMNNVGDMQTSRRRRKSRWPTSHDQKRTGWDGQTTVLSKD